MKLLGNFFSLLLQRFQAAPSEDTWPFAAISLHLDGLILDKSSHFVKVSASQDGETFTDVYSGNAGLPSWEDGPFVMSFPLDSRPTQVRVQIGGFASLALTRVRIEDVAGTSLPTSVVEHGGSVTDPEHLLVFDKKVAIFNESDMMASSAVNRGSNTPPFASKAAA